MYKLFTVSIFSFASIVNAQFDDLINDDEVSEELLDIWPKWYTSKETIIPLSEVKDQERDYFGYYLEADYSTIE